MLIAFRRPASPFTTTSSSPPSNATQVTYDDPLPGARTRIRRSTCGTTCCGTGGAATGRASGTGYARTSSTTTSRRRAATQGRARGVPGLATTPMLRRYHQRARAFVERNVSADGVNIDSQGTGLPFRPRDRYHHPFVAACDVLAGAGAPPRYARCVVSGRGPARLRRAAAPATANRVPSRRPAPTRASAWTRSSRSTVRAALIRRAIRLRISGICDGTPPVSGATASHVDAEPDSTR